MPILSGTFTTVQGNAAVTATGATLVGQIFSGDLVQFGTTAADAQGSFDKFYEVKTDASSDSGITLATAYNETGAAGLKCWYWPTSASRTARLPATLSTQVTNLTNRYGGVLTYGGADQRITLTKTASTDYAEIKYVQGSTEFWRSGMSGDNDWGLDAKINSGTWTDVFRVTVSGSSPNQIATGTFYQPFGIAHQTLFTGPLTPTSLSADQNDYSPTGLSGDTVLRLQGTAARSITGMAGGTDGRVLIIENVGSYNLTLVSQSASSTAANRFIFPADIVVIPNSYIILKYDATSSRWRCIAGSSRALLYASASDKFLYSTGANAWAEGSVTSQARGVLASTNITVSGTLSGVGVATPLAEWHVLKTNAGGLGPTLLLENRDSTANSAANIDFAMSGVAGTTLARIQGIRTGRLGGAQTDIVFFNYGSSLSEAARIRDDGLLTTQGGIKVGNGSDASAVTGTVLYATNAGASNIAVRDSTNDVEQMFYAYSGGGIIGTVTNHSLDFRTNNIARMSITNGGIVSFVQPHKLPIYTVGTLPAGSQGYKAVVTDANSTTYNSTATAGGANVVEVLYNGSAWKIS